MSVLSGKVGLIDNQTAIKNWKTNITSDNQAFIASSTQGGPGRVTGNKDWSGSFEGVKPVPDVVPGETFTFTGSVDGATGVYGPAIVDSVEVAIDIEGGGIISHTVNFSGDGAATLGAAVATDVIVPEPESAIGCKLQYDVAGAGSWTELTDVRTITFTLMADNQAYVSSATAGWSKRVTGNFDAELTVSFYTDADMSGLPTVGDAYGIKAFINATEFWLFSWMRINELADIEVDRETGAVVGASFNMAFSGIETISATPTVGVVEDPDSTEVWPEIAPSSS